MNGLARLKYHEARVLRRTRKSHFFFVAHVAQCSVANPHFATEGATHSGFSTTPGFSFDRLDKKTNTPSSIDPQIHQEADYLQ